MAEFEIIGLKEIEDELKKTLEQISDSGKTAAVGFFEESTYPDGTPAATVAYWNEYGRHVESKDGDYFILPAPFMRTAADEYGNSWIELVRDHLANGKTIEEALARVAKIMEEDVRESGMNGNWPPNAPSTVKIKGFDQRLVDTSLMLNTFLVGRVIDD